MMNEIVLQILLKLTKVTKVFGEECIPVKPGYGSFGSLLIDVTEYRNNISVIPSNIHFHDLHFKTNGLISPLLLKVIKCWSKLIFIFPAYS